MIIAVKAFTTPNAPLGSVYHIVDTKDSTKSVCGEQLLYSTHFIRSGDIKEVNCANCLSIYKKHKRTKKRISEKRL